MNYKKVNEFGFEYKINVGTKAMLCLWQHNLDLLMFSFMTFTYMEGFKQFHSVILKTFKIFGREVRVCVHLPLCN